MDCGDKCRSKLHALELIAAVIRGSDWQIKTYVRRCSNYLLAKDHWGRTLLHVAASCGKLEVVEWLLSEGCAVNPQDSESGWTPLHRALFYGQLATGVALLQNGASLYPPDHEGLTPLDLLVKDRPAGIVFSATGLNDVYTWGDNSNFTLGHGSELKKTNPEVLEYFRKQRISLKKVVLQKYHSLYLTSSGQVYSCGHGRGGRLGLADEDTSLSPRLITCLQHEGIRDVCAGRDHSVFLTESGQVFSCGLNQHHQLGLFPPPDKALIPKQMNSKQLKGLPIEGVCVGHFHTVLLVKGGVYTFGLNGGQLGHPKGDPIQSQPRLVSAFNHKDMIVRHVACSSEATVCITAKGDIYVLHEFLCRKISSKWLDVSQVAVYGGKVDHPSRSEHPLLVAILNTTGTMFLWSADYPSFRRCSWMTRRSLSATSMALNESGLVFSTKDGDVFVAKFHKLPSKQKETMSPSKVSASSPSSSFPTLTLSDIINQDDAVEIAVKRISYVHRAVSVTTDGSGFNYAILQSQPHTDVVEVPSVSHSVMCQQFDALFQEADCTDLIHDVVLKIGATEVPAHKFILSGRSSYFKKTFISESLECSELPIEGVTEQIFLQLLQFIYTDTCDLLKPGNTFQLQKSGQGAKHISDSGLSDLSSVTDNGRQSAFKVFHEQRKKQGKKHDVRQDSAMCSDPVKLLMDVAKRFGVDSLVKKLSAVKYVDGYIQLVKGKSFAPQRLKFARSMLPSLYDVCLKAEDGTLFQCHKCVLVARLEYFHSMLATGWMETSLNEPLSLPLPPAILKIVLDFLYSGQSSSIVGNEDLELLCNLLVVADQLLIGRLREMCEVEICSLVTLKTVAELLEFSTMYNAEQLKSFCQQFVCHNLATLTETRSLDVLGKDALEELTQYYRRTTPAMCCRLITPYSCTPSSDDLESLTLEETVEVSPRKAKSKKKRNRTQSSSSDTKPQGDDIKISEKSSEMAMPVQEERQTTSVSTQSLAIDIKGIDTSLHDNSVPANSGGSGQSPCRQRTPSSSSVDQHLGVWGSPRSDVGFCQSPTDGAPSLREIMNQQSQSDTSARIIKVKMPKLPKKSNIHKQSPKVPVTAADEETSSVKTTCPWGKVDSTVHSLKDVMASEQVSVIPKENKPRPVGGVRVLARPVKDAQSSKQLTVNTSLSWGLPKRDVKTDDGKPSNEASATSPWKPVPSPWSPDGSSKPGSDFSKILQLEMNQAEQLEKATSKPLHLIQIEERAIAELLEHYGAEGNCEELISVERVNQTVARPLWRARSDR